MTGIAIVAAVGLSYWAFLKHLMDTAVDAPDEDSGAPEGAVIIPFPDRRRS